jgi:hypothetical protein
MSHYLQRSAQRQAEQKRRGECTRKRRYPSQWGANEAIRSTAPEAGVLPDALSGDETLHAYSCEHCAGWHIGHPPRRVAP